MYLYKLFSYTFIGYTFGYHHGNNQKYNEVPVHFSAVELTELSCTFASAYIYRWIVVDFTVQSLHAVWEYHADTVQ